MKRSVIAAALIAASASMAVAPAQATVPTEQTAADERAAKKMRKAVATGSLWTPIRSRGRQAKPKRHTNRLHTSKRTRRKHRRAA